jgi:hypothetical protein
LADPKEECHDSKHLKEAFFLREAKGECHDSEHLEEAFVLREDEAIYVLQESRDCSLMLLHIFTFFRSLCASLCHLYFLTSSARCATLSPDIARRLFVSC